MALLACALTVARRPDAFVRPQLWGEDGPIFFQAAWNEGALHPLITTYGGYLVTAQRLVASLAAAIGLRSAPLLFNLAGLAAQVAPAVYFVSTRCEPLVRSRLMRVLIAVIYLLLPDAEININLTNLQWHLAVLAFLIIMVPPADRLWTRIAETTVVLLAALTGPFGIVLVPIAGIWCWRHRSAARLRLLAVTGAATLVQIIASVLGPARHLATLGASAPRFIEIVANRVFLAGIFAQDEHATYVIKNFGSGLSLAFAVAIFVGGSAILAFVLWRGPLALKLFLALGAAVLAGGLISPLVAAGNHVPQWPKYLHPPAAGRYFFIAQLAWLVSLLWAITRWRVPTARLALVTLLCVCVGLGVGSEWSYPALPNLHLDRYAKALAKAPRGEVVVIPLNPIDPAYAKVMERETKKSYGFGYLPHAHQWEMQLIAGR